MRLFFSKKTIIVFLTVIVLLSSFLIYKKIITTKSEPKYLLAKVVKGDINITTEGSGYVVAADEINIYSKVNSRVIYMPFREGDYVKKGTILAKLDSSDLEKQIRDLNLNLENANINLEKLNEQYDKLKRADTLKSIYEKSLPILNKSFNDYDGLLDKLNTIYFGNEFSDIGDYNNNLEYYLGYFNSDYRIKAENYKRDFDNIKLIYKNLSYNFSFIKNNPQQFNVGFLNDVYKFNSDLLNFIKFGIDLIRKIKTQQFINQSIHIKQDLLNNHLDSLFEIYQDLSSYNLSLLDLINSFNEYNDSIKNLELDIKNAQINIEQIKAKITDSKETLNDYVIYSPISGYIKTLNIQKGGNVSANSILMTISTVDKIAEINLNEIDLKDMKIGNEAILTFDALPNFKTKGKVIYISPIGEYNQGVVSYKVKISIDDSRKVKIGMSVDAVINIDKKSNVLIVPNQAIKSIENKKYVEIPNKKDLDKIIRDNKNIKSFKNRITVNLNYPLEMKVIKTGLNDNDNIEILEGLSEGEWVVIKKIESGNKTVNQTSQQGLFQRLMPQPTRIIRSPGIR